MLLRIPAVGDEAGPDYALDVNFDLASILDSHDHTPGRGVQITPAALNINTALPINNNFITNIAGLTLMAQSSTPAINTIYESGVDLFFVDGIGNNIRLTQSGGVAGTPGSIGGLAPPASVTYSSGSQTFVFQSGIGIAANLDGGSLLMRNLSPNSTFALTLSPPSSLANDYTITMPLPPGAPSFLAMDSSGTITAAPTILGALTTSNLSPTAGILGTQIAAATINGSNLVSNIDLAGNLVTENGKAVVIANTNAASSLAIIRCAFNSSGGLVSGEGASAVLGSPGAYAISFSTAFADVPMIQITPAAFAVVGFTTSVASSSVLIQFVNLASTPTSVGFNFLAIGQRA